ncbi:MAG TPA: Hsp20/alpha crystallin family protein [Bacillota bacterium]|nr:Hsp20/alpha crystallin family protein [Bacillota bacterium]
MIDPFQQMNEWRKNLDQFFGENFWNDFESIIKPNIPQINMYKTENEILCYVNVPGMSDINQIEIYADHTTLELRGNIHLDYAQGSVVREEILQGNFDRKIQLPYPVRSDKIDATYQHGVLIIQLHRLISDKSSRNKVNIRMLEDE